MEGKITLNEKPLKFSVLRSRRRKRTIALGIEPTGEVLVRAPFHIPHSRLIEVVESKRGWIIKKLRSLDNISPVVKKEFVSGESFPYLGRHLRLKIRQGHHTNKPVVNIGRGRLEVLLNTASNGIRIEEIKGAVVFWYKTQAARYIPERVKIYAKKMGLAEPTILIRNQQKIWGSCNAKGVLRFNWRMMMAPVSLIDYVVVHELCHLKHKNHAVPFWKYLHTIMPDYEKRKEALRRNGIGYNWQ